MSEHPLDIIFNPRSCAVVGVSSSAQGGRMGGSFLAALMEAGFHKQRPLYPVNPKADEIAGLKCYPSVLDCPGPVDHVISQIPARAVPELVDQCIEKGVHSIHFFTAGFSETGDAEMAEMEREIVAKARAANMRLIGPNCMGLYVPAVGLAFMGAFPTTSGNTFLLSQSGANAGEIVGALTARGVRFSKVVSYGNGADLQAHDFIDYAASDPETEIVIAYIEGVKDGRAFFDALKRCAAVKPTIVLKGGLTSAGARAANSHTGSLAGSMEVFDAACRQTGALRAETMEDLHDFTVAAATMVRNVEGPGVVLASGPGGFAVLSADAIAAAGLELPEMPQATQDELHEFIPVAGTSVRNPIDSSVPGNHGGGGGEDLMARTYRLVAAVDGVHAIFANAGGWGGAGRWGGHGDGERERPSPEQLSEQARAAADRLAGLQEDLGIPIVSFQHSRGEGGDSESLEAYHERAFERGLGVFPSLQRAARSMAAMWGWQARREGLPALR